MGAFVGAHVGVGLGATVGHAEHDGLAVGCEDGAALGEWVHRQRTVYKKGAMSDRTQSKVGVGSNGTISRFKSASGRDTGRDAGREPCCDTGRDTGRDVGREEGLLRLCCCRNGSKSAIITARRSGSHKPSKLVVLAA